MKQDITSKNRRYTAVAWLLALLVLAVAVPLNLIFDRLNVNFDMTPNSLYTLTDTTVDFLNDLDAKGEKVDVYFLTEMAELHDDLRWLALYRTVTAYAEHPCFNLIDFDPDTRPDIIAQINPDEQFNLAEGDFLFVHGDKIKRLPAKMLYQFTYKTKEDGSQFITDAKFCAENYFTSYMKTVVDGDVPYIYFTEGHDEIPLEKMSRLKANLGNTNYGAKTIDLSDAAEVPRDCCILMLVSPQSDLTNEEYDVIYRYTQEGGQLCILLSPNEAKTTYPNLEKLMRTYCIAMNYDRVEESDPDRHSHSEPYAFMCDLAAPSPETGVDLTSALLEASESVQVFMPYSRSFYSIFSEEYTNMKTDSLLLTQSSAVSNPFGGKQLDAVSKDGQQLSLAMYSQDSTRYDSKLVVFGNGEFITDDYVSDAHFIQPLHLFLSSITWMYNSDVDMGIEDKDRTYDTMTVNSDKEASSLIAVFAAYPALVAAAGLIIWLRRRNA